MHTFIYSFMTESLGHCENPSTTKHEILTVTTIFLVCFVPPRRFCLALCKADRAALSSGTRCVSFCSDTIVMACALMDTFQKDGYVYCLFTHTCMCIT